ncbi:MAG TPA: hypothetical protein VH415_03075 [Nitrososphaeraceae archaeon]|jgi:DNA-binding Lrp family transcriptional regulator
MAKAIISPEIAIGDKLKAIASKDTLVTRESSENSHILDNLDYQIINLLTSGFDIKGISDELRISLSTIHRRVRRLLEFGYVNHIFQPNCKKLGLRKRFLYFNLRSRGIRKVAADLLSIDGIISAGIHVGNSGIVAEFVYEDTEQLVDMISHVKEMSAIKKVQWSEEVCLIV